MGGSVDVLLPDHRLRGWRQRHEPLPIQPPFPIEAFTHDRKRLSAIRGLEHGRWHLSISHPMRLPTWAEVGEARDALLPADIFLCVPHPPRRLWLNLHPYVLHLWEIKDETLIQIWTADGEEAQRLGVGRPS